MKGYKAFKKGMICMGKQYAENTVFEEDEAKICNKGMHFCKQPLDVLKYYPLVDENGEMSEFAEIEAEEAVTNDGRKYCTKKLKIGRKISFPQLVQAAIDFFTRDSVYITSTGDNARLSSAQDNASISSTGFDTSIISFGVGTCIGSTGDCASISSTGDGTCISSTGYMPSISSTGRGGCIYVSSDSARIASSGDDVCIGSIGDSACITSAGDDVCISSTGDGAHIVSSGDNTCIASTGKYSVIMCGGNGSVVKANKDSWITLSEWGYKNEEYMQICVKTEFVDGNRIKEGTYYKLENGLFVEVNDEN